MRLASVLAGVAAGMVVCAPAGAQSAEEYDVKAAFLYRFTQFVEWEPDAFPSADAPLHLCILGHDPFDGALAQIVAGESAHGHPLSVRHVSDPRLASGCHVAFVSRFEDPEWIARLPADEARRRLTIGETPEALGLGALLRFRVDGSRVRLEVNGPELERSALRISSKLLNLATVIEPGP
jgi:hypothetical protein